MKSIDVSQSIFTALASKSFMGAIHSLHKYIQALNRNSSTAQTTMKHEEQVYLVGCTRTFSKQKNIRVMCDASHDALSDNFTHNRDKNSTNKLRMLSVVWSAEFSGCYILKQSFTVISNHRTLITLPNGNSRRETKTMFIRLTS